MKLLSSEKIDLSRCAIVDFETYYDDEVSITTLGTVGYIRHPMFDAYMVSVVNDSIQWVGHPDDFDWSQLDGYTLAAHNASFDQFIVQEMEYMTNPTSALDNLPQYVDFICTADLSAFLQAPRSLSGAAHTLLRKKVDKSMRSAAKGKHWPSDFNKDEQQRMLDYALQDSVNAWALLKKHVAEWPWFERKLSEVTRLMGWGGVPVDLSELTAAEEHLKQVLFECEQALPWSGEIDPLTKKPFALLSPKALAYFCAKEGVKPPPSLAKDDLGCQEWVAKYGDRIPWIAAMQDYRSINSHLAKVQAMHARVVPFGDGYRMPYGLKYHGADTTARWSGDSGFNTQNLTKGLKFKVDLRALIRCATGYGLGIADLANIEPRCMYYVAEDHAPIKLLQKGLDIYEVHARLTMGYTNPRPLKEVDPKLRDLAKVRVLQLGYGSGWFKLYQSALKFDQLHVFEEPYTKEERGEFLDYVVRFNKALVPFVRRAKGVTLTHYINAYKQVMDFRAKSPKIVGLWRRYGEEFASCVGRNYVITLPSGREMTYFNVRPGEDGLECQTTRGGPFLKFYGAKFVENVCQATARDVFATGLLRVVEELDILPVLQVHDELVIEAAEADLPRLCSEIERIFAETPAWLGDTPLSSESKVSTYYTK